MPFEICRRWALLVIIGQIVNSLAVEAVVFPSVFEFFPDLFTHLDCIFGGYGDVSLIEDLMEVGAQKQAV
jgi:hypothetical protein